MRPKVRHLGQIQTTVWLIHNYLAGLWNKKNARGRKRCRNSEIRGEGKDVVMAQCAGKEKLQGWQKTRDRKDAGKDQIFR
jgi:hypothetical protein